MINPFANRIAAPLLLEAVEEATRPTMFERVKAALEEATPKQVRRAVGPIMARCGGLYRPNSIKQKTRLNRDRRNDRY